jgi:DNA-binding HxlR family transcriptional regulator|tara:strand:+ start:486 stop:656 length:171 start_codon:yes stop_codon:yes gene_type:complete
MTVEELIEELQKIEDKTLDVRLEDDETNKWVERVEAHYQGGSGYELHGEVILVASE